MHNKIVFQQELLNKLKTGADTLAEAVGSTLGPNGRNVIVQYGGQNLVTKDGVTVAKSILSLEDETENIACQLIKEVATKTANEAGDGTTTATILAQFIFNEGLNYISNRNKNWFSQKRIVNPIELNKGIQAAVKEVTQEILNVAQKIDGSKEKLVQIATISANNDKEIGEIVGELMFSVGKDGVVNIESSASTDTYHEQVKGYRMNSGFISPRFVNTQAQECSFDNPYILLCEDKISTMKEILPAMELAMAGPTQRPLLIIAEDVDGEALQTLVLNFTRGNVPLCAVRVPAHAQNKKIEYLDDIGFKCGGSVFSHSGGHNIQDINRIHFGQAKKVIITKDSTTIYGGQGNDSLIEDRIELIRTQIQAATDTREKRYLEHRLSALSVKSANIYVGGYSTIEVEEKKFRVEDAICATVAAMEEGIVPGGGLCYLKINRYIGMNVPEEVQSEDFNAGFRIVTKALLHPIACIVKNSGRDVNQIIKEIDLYGETYGYNAKTNKFEDLLSCGIIDPAKVARVALEHAASVAGTLLTTACAVFVKK